MTEMTIDRPRTRVLRPLLEGAVVVMFLLLIWSNYTLRRQARAAAIPTVSQHGFVPRDYVESIPVIDLQGQTSTLDLRNGRTTIAIVDPRCDSCRELVASMHGDAEVRVISMSPAVESKTLGPQTLMLGKSLPQRLESKLQIYPQLFVVERGKVVRSCASMAECR